jgi:hypothetical protein
MFFLHLCGGWRRTLAGKTLMFENLCGYPGASRRLKRNLLNSSCLLTAFLAVPAVLPVSLTLAPPAQAQTSLGNSSNEVILNGAGTNPFSVGAGVTINVGGNDGIYGDTTQAWTLSNAGTVRSEGAEGVDLKSANGTLTNLGGGLIYGSANGAELGTGAAVVNSGTIQGSASDGGVYGILLDGTGSVSNTTTGTIAGPSDGIYAENLASVSNAGVITGAGTGAVDLSQGGTVSNLGTGTITGASAAAGINIAGNSGSVDNAGTVTGGTDGVDLAYVNGTLTNLGGGLIYGATNGAELGTGAVVANSGTIESAASGSGGIGILLDGTGSVSNSTGGTIAGYVSGIYSNEQASVSNAGLITNGIAGNGAVALSQGGTVGNLGTGTIIGVRDGIDILGGSGFVDNAGTVTGGDSGVYIGGPGGSVTNAVSGDITGGGSGLTINAPGGSLVNAGSITGTAVDGVTLLLGGSATNAVGGTIQGAIYGLVGGYSNNLVGNATDVQNSGVIYGGGTGVLLYGLDGGQVTNYAGGTISGGGVGVGVLGGVGSITNSGLIQGGTFTGVYLKTGEITNAASGTISGNYGVIVNNTGSVTNSGQIDGDVTAVYLSTGNVTNMAGGTISGVEYGVYLHNAGDSLTNAGLVKASAGDAVYSEYGATVVNQAGGSIVGGSANAGIRIGYANNTGPNIGIVQNSGSIYGGTGILLYGLGGGSVTNAVSGDITGAAAGLYIGGAAGSVVNAGSIIGTADDGVALRVGGSVTNAVGGYIYGGTIGVAGGYFGNTAANTVDLQNSGTIKGYAGVLLYGLDDGEVTNFSGGTIAGRHQGVYIRGADASLTNSGLIEGDFAGAIIDHGQVTNQAGGTIAGSYGVILNSSMASLTNSGSIAGTVSGVFDYNGEVTNNAGGTISALNMGVYLYKAGGGLTNAGLVTASGGSAVFGEHGATVVNQAGGTLAGAGGYAGIRIGYAINTMSNIGIVQNSGSIFGGSGVELYGQGSVTNAVSGRINGADTGVFIGGPGGSVVNAGYIAGNDRGVNLRLGGNATNSAGGTIASGEVALVAGYAQNTGGNAANVQNSGLIEGGGTGVLLYGLAGEQITNFSGGTISGNGVGVGEFGGVTSLTNSGLIEGSGFTGIFIESGTIANAASGTISGNYGVIINVTGSLTNSGQVEGTDSGIFVLSGAVTNTSAGTISGANKGIFFITSGDVLNNSGLVTASAGNAVFSQYGATVINQSGGSLAGAVSYTGIQIGYGTNTGSNIGIVQNSGSISGGSGVVLDGEGGGTLTNMAGGNISGGGHGVIITNGAGTVDNAGIIYGASYYGVAINSGQISNASTGTITGGGGVDIYGAGTVINSGLIAGGNGARIGSGSVINNSTGTISGTRDGVYLYAAGDSLSNAGIINGGTAGGDIGAYMVYGGSALNQASGHISGNIGVQVGYRNDSFTGSGLIDNQGVISGDTFGIAFFNLDGGSIDNAAGATISGGVDGIYTALVTSSISNSGTITGGSNGVEMAGGVLTNAAGALIDGDRVGLLVTGSAQISNAGTIRDSAGAGAILAGAATLTNSGTVSGVTGLILSGDSAAVINSGVISSTQAGGNAILITSLDPAQITLTSGSALTGAIDGGGTDGQILLQGSNQMGNDIINFGTGSALGIVSGANWIATGNWTIANVTNNGTFQPGVLGTPLMLTGDYTQSPAGTMQVVVTPTMSSQFLITGNAALAGSIKYVFAPGTYVPHVYDFLTATGMVTGNYTSVTYSGAAPTIFTRSTTILTDSANLVLAGSGTQDTTPVAPSGSSPAGTPPVSGSTPTGVVAPADGSVFSAGPQVLAEITQQDTGLLLGKAAQGANAGSAACAAADEVSPLATSPNGAPKAAAFASFAARAVCGAGGWVAATGGVLNADASGGAPSYAADTAGFMAGIDREVSDAGTRLGLSVGYDQVDLHDDAEGKFSSGVTHVGLYGSQPLGRFMLAAELSGGFANNSTTRQTGIGALRDSNETDIVSGGLQGGTQFSLGPVLLSPQAGIRFASVSGGGIDETARGVLGAFAVSGDTPNYSSVQPYVSLYVSRPFSTGNGIVVIPNASLGDQVELADHGQAADVRAADGTAFATAHNNLDGNAALLGLGISAGKAGWSVYVNYAAHVAGNWTEQTGEVGVQARF